MIGLKKKHKIYSIDTKKYSEFINQRNESDLMLIRKELVEDIENIKKEIKASNKINIFSNDKLKTKQKCLKIVNKRINSKKIFHE